MTDSSLPPEDEDETPEARPPKNLPKAPLDKIEAICAMLDKVGRERATLLPGAVLIATWSIRDAVTEARAELGHARGFVDE